MLNDDLVQTWEIHHRICLYLLDAIPSEALGAVSLSKGRSVGQMLAHIHNVRVTWLDNSALRLAARLAKVPARKKDDFTPELLRDSLQKSGEAMKTLLAHGFESGKIKDARPHPAGFFGYILAHEWYHIGEIGMTLEQVGFPLPEEVSFGLWEWSKR